MATAATSSLAGTCGLHAAVIPLLSLAIAQAAWIPVACAVRQYNAPAGPPRSWFAIGPPVEHSGVHTVPLGLAIIATGLVVHPGPMWFAAASVCLLLTWLATVLCIGRFAISLFRVKPVLRHLDGAWFLVPATLLGAAVATTTLSLHTTSNFQPQLMRLAVIAASAGLVNYWIVAGAAAVRILRYGLGDDRVVLWWIAMGCAGLAAAAIASVLQALHAGPVELHQSFVRRDGCDTRSRRGAVGAGADRQRQLTQSLLPFSRQGSVAPHIFHGRVRTKLPGHRRRFASGRGPRIRPLCGYRNTCAVDGDGAVECKHRIA